jgi:hypothetical protein
METIRTEQNRRWGIERSQSGTRLYLWNGKLAWSSPNQYTDGQLAGMCHFLDLHMVPIAERDPESDLALAGGAK